MAKGDKREEIDLKIKGWERELEKLRVALARAPETVHARYYPSFIDLYRAKEVVKSRWETVRGVYRPAPEAIHRFEEALKAMEDAWAGAQPMLAEVLAPKAA